VTLYSDIDNGFHFMIPSAQEGTLAMTLRIPRLVGILAAALAVLGVAGCGGSDPAAQPPDDRLTVVASTDVWASVVRAVAGDPVEIKTIIHDPAGDPHSYESTPTDAATMQHADLVVFNGGGYDEFMTQILARTPDKPAIEAYSLATSLATGTNEHVWYDLSVVDKVADQVAAELGKLAPERAQQFIAGAKTFETGISDLRTKVSAIADAHAGTPVAMTEPVAYYLVEAARLTDLTPPEFIQAVEEETDPPAAAVAATKDLFTRRQVRVLIYNAQTETPVTSQVRADSQAAAIPVVPMTETLPEGTGYLRWMSGQIDALSAALG
jgi:zinc/manganese transport system substrate-binding protein